MKGTRRSVLAATLGLTFTSGCLDLLPGSSESGSENGDEFTLDTYPDGVDSNGLEAGWFNGDPFTDPPNHSYKYDVRTLREARDKSGELVDRIDSEISLYVSPDNYTHLVVDSDGTDEIEKSAKFLTHEVAGFWFSSMYRELEGPANQIFDGELRRDSHLLVNEHPDSESHVEIEIGVSDDTDSFQDGRERAFNTAFSDGTGLFAGATDLSLTPVEKVDSSGGGPESESEATSVKFRAEEVTVWLTKFSTDDSWKETAPASGHVIIHKDGIIEFADISIETGYIEEAEGSLTFSYEIDGKWGDTVRDEDPGLPEWREQVVDVSPLDCRVGTEVLEIENVGNETVHGPFGISAEADDAWIYNDEVGSSLLFPPLHSKKDIGPLFSLDPGEILYITRDDPNLKGALTSTLNEPPQETHTVFESYSEEPATSPEFDSDRSRILVYRLPLTRVTKRINDLGGDPEAYYDENKYVWEAAGRSGSFSEILQVEPDPEILLQ